MKLKLMENMGAHYKVDEDWWSDSSGREPAY
jgi:hypothetical protein